MSKRELKKSTLINEHTNKPKASKDRHYVDNDKLYKALVKRRDNQEDRVTEYIGHAFMEISSNLANKHQFRNYPFKEDMIMEGVTSCVKYIDNFDVDKYDKPFNYFTTICYYAFIGVIPKEKQQLYIKLKASSNALAQGEVADMGDSDIFAESIISSMGVSPEYINEFIETYEESNNLNKNEKQRKKRNANINRVTDFYD
jgi:hypothetical protein